MTFFTIRTAMIAAGTIVLSACATTQTAQQEQPASVSQDAKPMKMGDKSKMKAMHAEKMKAMPEACKPVMAKMKAKMKDGGMDMAAMKAKMKSGEGMSDEQKKCHTAMHENMQAMHKEKMKAKHEARMKAMPEACKPVMAKMHEKMKAKMKDGGMDMAAMKEKMKSGEGMSDEQKKCHATMHENMQAMHKEKMKAKHAEKMKAMPEACKPVMAKMKAKMKDSGMDMAAMKEKMKSGEGMSDEQKKCHAAMHENMKAKKAEAHSAHHE